VTTVHRYALMRHSLFLCNAIRLNIDKNKRVKRFELEIESLISKIDQSISFESAGTFFDHLHPVRIG
jgi:hypothetical protein